MRSGELHDATRMRGRKQRQRSRPPPVLAALADAGGVEPRLAPRLRQRRQRMVLDEDFTLSESRTNCPNYGQLIHDVHDPWQWFDANLGLELCRLADARLSASLPRAATRSESSAGSCSSLRWTASSACEITTKKRSSKRDHSPLKRSGG